MPLETGTSPERGSKNFLVHLRRILVLRCRRSTTEPSRSRATYCQPRQGVLWRRGGSRS